MATTYWALDGNAGTNPPDDFLGTKDNQPLVLKTNRSEAVRIDSTGNVGIGTTSPGAKLTVDDPTSNTIWNTAAFRKAALGPHWSHIHWGPTGDWYIRSAASNGKVVLQDNGGNVGVGTSNPEATLHSSSGYDFHVPQVKVTQTTPNDFARVQLESFRTDVDSATPLRLPLWDIAAGRGVLNFFRQDTGNVMTLTNGLEPGGGIRASRVGIGTENPQTTLEVKGTARVDVLEITGGGDLAEPFPVLANKTIEPGTVMVIDESHPARLKISDTAYDCKVAGIVSGAGGINRGLTIQQGHMSKDHAHVALAGCVYCKAEAISNPIQPGDLLTTSDVPGHAMKAADR